MPRTEGASVEALRLAAGVLVAWGAGRGLLAAAGLERRGGVVAQAARAWLIGVCALALAWLPLVRWGVRFDWVTVAISGLLPAVLLSLPAWRRRPAPGRDVAARATDQAPVPGRAAWRDHLAVLLTLTVVLFVAKTLRSDLELGPFRDLGGESALAGRGPTTGFDFLGAPALRGPGPTIRSGCRWPGWFSDWAACRAAHLQGGPPPLRGFAAGAALRRRSPPRRASCRLCWRWRWPRFRRSTGTPATSDWRRCCSPRWRSPPPTLVDTVSLCAAPGSGASAGALPWIKQEGYRSRFSSLVPRWSRPAPRLYGPALWSARCRDAGRSRPSRWFQLRLAGDVAGYLGSGGVRAAAAGRVGSIVLAFVKELLVGTGWGSGPFVVALAARSGADAHQRPRSGWPSRGSRESTWRSVRSPKRIPTIRFRRRSFVWPPPAPSGALGVLLPSRRDAAGPGAVPLGSRCVVD